MNKLIISGPINYKLFRRLVEEFDEVSSSDLHIIMTSEGGSEGVGRAIAGWLKMIARKKEVTIDAYGDVQSSATLIFAAGTKRRLSRYAQIMVHESTMDIDDESASEIKKVAKQMELDEKFWCGILAELTGTDSKIWEKLHSDETYLTPDEALKLNLATELI